MLSQEDMAALTAAEEKRLGLNSPEFIRRHNEIMETADRIRRENKKRLCQSSDLTKASSPQT